MEMLYSQEDVWVLASLMEIIKETNGGASHSSQAVVKEIESIDIGSTVGLPKGKVSAIQAPASEDGEDDFGMDDFGMDDGYGDGYGGGGGYGDGYGGGGMGYGDEEGGTMMMDPLEGRYVDEFYQPVDPETMRTNAQSTSLGDIQVAKRMPVRIRVKMDSRKLPVLLSACANAPLTFEVHQFRLNPSADAGMGMGMGMGMMGGGGYGGAMGGGYGEGGGAGGDAGGYGSAMGGGYGGGGYGGGYGGGMGGYGGGMYGEEENAFAESYVRTVELFGVIYIYNPVDKAKLGTSAPADGSGDEPGTDDVAGL